MRSFATIFLALSLPLCAFAAHDINHRRHANITLNRRQGQNARMTFYDITTGTTACGHNHGANDFVVALNAAQFGNNPGNSPFCGKSITITCNGKSTSATIDDKCPGCPEGGLDLTQGLFEYFAPIGQGVLSCDWTVGGGAAPAPAPAPAPTTSSTPPPPSPTTHYTPPTTSQQWTSSSEPPSSSSSSTSTSSTSKSSSSVSSAAPTSSHESSSTSSSAQTSGAEYNNGPASSLAQPTGSISPGQNQSINTIYGAIIGMGSLVT